MTLLKSLVNSIIPHPPPLPPHCSWLLMTASKDVEMDQLYRHLAAVIRLLTHEFFFSTNTITGLCQISQEMEGMKFTKPVPPKHTTKTTNTGQKEFIMLTDFLQLL